MIPSIPPKQPKLTINSIQALRGIAALLVVTTHVETALRENGKTGIPWVSHFPGLSGFGGVGVDIFFVISGFIMAYVGVRYFRGEGSIRDFLARRVLRIYPLYWLITLIYICAALTKTLFSLFEGQHFTEALDFDLQLHRLVGAFTLFPTYNELGNLQPIVGVGWTLSYEVFFYLIFALTLSLGFRFSLFVVILIFSFLIFAPLPLGDSALTTFLKNPILLEFPAGMLLGYAVVLGLHPPRWIVISSVFLGLLGFLASILFAFDYTYHYLHRGIPSTLLIFGLVFWESRFGLKIAPFLTRVGDASYSIYLIHSFVISYLFKPIIQAVPAVQKMQVDILGLIMFVLATLTGILFYNSIEKPLQRFVMTRYEKTAQQNFLASTKQS